MKIEPTYNVKQFIANCNKLLQPQFYYSKIDGNTYDAEEYLEFDEFQEKILQSKLKGQWAVLDDCEAYHGCIDLTNVEEWTIVQMLLLEKQ